MPLELSFDQMFVGEGGLQETWLTALAAEAFPELHDDLSARGEAGRPGFQGLADGGELVDKIRRFADGAGQAFENVVVLGIGRSALGARALRAALLGPWWNELSLEARDYYPRLHILDNVDPDTVGQFLDELDLGRSLFNVVSRSGATPETAAQLLIVRAALESELGEGYRRHLVFTTDPEVGPLREIAAREGIIALPVPPDVEGRFSVLSAVGLLPAALVGIDIEELLAGAREMRERCAADELHDNPAAMLAACLYLADSRCGAHVHVMMPYSDRLGAATAWYRQLWAESLGVRRGGDGSAIGPTPVAARGATEGHSQLRLFVEGPRNKVLIFVSVERNREDLEIPDLSDGDSPFAYLGGRTLGELLRTGLVATREALAREGRPSLTIGLPRLEAHELGEFFMLWQLAAVYAAGFYGVDRSGRPGVELSTRLLREKLGAPDGRGRA